MNQKLKPLNPKQVHNNVNKPLNTNHVIGKPVNASKIDQKPSLQKKSSQGNSNGNTLPITSKNSTVLREIKTPMKQQRTSTKKIEMYDCDDFDLQLEDNGNNKYFQGQLQKNIKQQETVGLGSTKKQPNNKALIVLPKLESQIKVKGTKDLQKEMDLQMSRILDKEYEDNMF